VIGLHHTSLIAACLTAAIGLMAPVRAQEAAAAADPASASASAATAASTASAEPDLVKGRRAFSRNCTVCHGLSGEGGLGPPLKGITTRLSADEITHQLKNPRGSMPRLYPAPIDDRLLADLLAYLQQLR